MKLLHCSKCNDIVALRDKKRYCLCKASAGRYIDDIKVLVSGPCNVLGFANTSFTQAIKESNYIENTGSKFTAFVIPSSTTAIREKYDSERSVTFISDEWWGKC